MENGTGAIPVYIEIVATGSEKMWTFSFSVVLQLHTEMVPVGYTVQLAV